MSKKSSAPEKESITAALLEEEKSNNLKRAFTVSEAAGYACVSRGTLEHWLSKRLLPFEELPCTGTKQRLRRIRKKDLDEFLEQNLVQTCKPPQHKAKQAHNDLFLIPKNA